MLLWQHWQVQLNNEHYKLLDYMIGHVGFETGEIVTEHMEYLLPLEGQGRWRWQLLKMNVLLQLLPG